MEPNTLLDSILGIFALLILGGGLLILLSGVRRMGDKP